MRLTGALSEPFARLWPPDASDARLDYAALVDAYAPADRSVAMLRVNFVVSADGAATLDGGSSALSSPADRRLMGILRMLSDAVVVGAATLRAEQYRPLTLSAERREWRVAHGLSPYPTLVVLGRGADLAAQPAVARAPVPARIVAPDDLAALRGLGYPQLLCEGGPRLFGSLLAADLVDELCLTVSPLLAGAGPDRITAGAPLPVPRQLALRHALSAEGLLFLRYGRQ